MDPAPGNPESQKLARHLIWGTVVLFLGIVFAFRLPSTPSVPPTPVVPVVRPVPPEPAPPTEEGKQPTPASKAISDQLLTAIHKRMNTNADGWRKVADAPPATVEEARELCRPFAEKATDEYLLDFEQILKSHGIPDSGPLPKSAAIGTFDALDRAVRKAMPLKP